MDNKFLELTSSPLMNLDHTYRYSGTKLVEAESLSQHIVDTIMMGLKIIDHINFLANDREYIDPQWYVMKAIFHDLEECVTGDIPRPLKYYNEATRDSLKGVAEGVAERLFRDQFIYWEDYYQMWDDAKSGDAGIVLKVVDTLVVANKVVKEVVLLNNFYMLRVAHEVSVYLVELRNSLLLCHSKSYEPRVNDYLIELIDGAIAAMRSIMENHHDTMNSLNIYKQSMI